MSKFLFSTLARASAQAPTSAGAPAPAHLCSTFFELNIPHAICSRTHLHTRYVNKCMQSSIIMRRNVRTFLARTPTDAGSLFAQKEDDTCQIQYLKGARSFAHPPARLLHGSPFRFRDIDECIMHSSEECVHLWHCTKWVYARIRCSLLTISIDFESVCVCVGVC